MQSEEERKDKDAKRARKNRLEEKIERIGEDRKCSFCGKDIPIKKRFGTKYCSRTCDRKAFRKDNPDYSRDYMRKSLGKYVISESKRVFERINSLGGKCEVCGNDDIRVLEMHHLSKKEKGNDFRTERFSKHKWKLLCANCHRLHHNFNWRLYELKMNGIMK